MAVGGATSSILYNLFSKITITARGLDSYTSCHFHKYGWPNNKSQTSTGEMSHNTWSVKGLMLYWRWHCWLMERSHPWWSHSMVYGCGCVVFSKPNNFTTSTKMRFFWLRIFLGLANFYRKFVLGFSHITWPLSQVTKGGAKEKFF